MARHPPRRQTLAASVDWSHGLRSADGVPKRSVVNLDNLQLVSRLRLVRRVGNAAPATMQRICATVAAAIDCP